MRLKRLLEKLLPTKHEKVYINDSYTQRDAYLDALLDKWDKKRKTLDTDRHNKI